MRKAIFLNILLILFFLTFVNSIFARSGCCSHHGGVCGCGCCDGTSLSSTCSPYYPECNGGNISQPTQPIYIPPTNTPYIPRPTNTPYPTNTPKPLPSNTPLPTATITPKPTETPKPIVTKTSIPSSTPSVLGESNKDKPSSTNVLTSLGGLGAIGYGIIRFVKRKI